MAVYKKAYRCYDGPLTASRFRFLVISRYAFESLSRSRFLSFYFLASFIYPAVCAILIYLHYNLRAIDVLKLDVSKLIAINARSFLSFLGFQSMLAFFLNAFVGPGLVAPDLANNALPLYLSRPLSRTEYVLGKMAVLAVLYSLMTWVPGLLLFALQGYLAGGGWAASNLRIAAALFFGAWIWILVLALLSLAVSAWVKWKPAAGALLFGVFFVASGFGAAINAVLSRNLTENSRDGNELHVECSRLFGEPL